MGLSYFPNTIALLLEFRKLLCTGRFVKEKNLKKHNLILLKKTKKTADELFLWPNQYQKGWKRKTWNIL